MANDASDPPEDAPVLETGVWAGAEPAQAQLLELARQGKDAWNNWREANSEAEVDFSCVDFTTGAYANINFSGFVFGYRASFADAVFGAEAGFDGAVFGDMASFARAAFGDWASFAGAVFGDVAHFAGASFGAEARFDGAAFGDRAYFDGAAFGEVARFDGAAFGDVTRFDGTAFGDWVRFNAHDESWLRDLEHRVARKLSDEARTRWRTARKNTSGNPGNFRTIDFSKARFTGGASFAGREFSASAGFAHTEFGQPPDFTATQGWDNMDWTGTRFGFAGEIRTPRAIPGTLALLLSLVKNVQTENGLAVYIVGIPHWITNTETAARLRRLKKIAADIHVHDAERDLFILERKAERGILWRDWRNNGGAERFFRVSGHIGVLAPYSTLSDCGRSILRPLMWLGAVNTAAYFAFDGLAKVGARVDALLTFTLSNLIPFFGASRTVVASASKELFEKDVLPAGVQALAFGQGITNAVLIFLLLLALRNHFRVK